MKEKRRAKIDGIETTLTFDQYSGARGYQYLTPDNSVSHAFQFRLEAGQAFHANGHHYEILD